MNLKHFVVKVWSKNGNMKVTEVMAENSYRASCIALGKFGDGIGSSAQVLGKW